MCKHFLPVKICLRFGPGQINFPQSESHLNRDLGAGGLCILLQKQKVIKFIARLIMSPT